MDGVINVYKEKGYTSHDVVAKLRKILGIKKIGHTGTLDPEAEGVLPICIGKATKLVSIITDGTKGYETVLRFGKTTTTGDHTGETINEFNYIFNEEDIKLVVNSFVGDYMQIPPMYSAIKVNGKKLYELAREGKVIERKPRKVHIYSIDIVEFLPPTAIKMRVICSKGTYIRTLCEDIGAKLGYGGHMDGLVRVSSSKFNLSNSITLDKLIQLKNNNNINKVLISIEDILSDYSKVKVSQQKDKFLLNGNVLKKTDLSYMEKEIRVGDVVRIYTSSEKFIGLYEVIKKQDSVLLKPFKILI